jgi:hypothetical protein
MAAMESQVREECKVEFTHINKNLANIDGKLDRLELAIIGVNKKRAVAKQSANDHNISFKNRLDSVEERMERQEKHLWRLVIAIIAGVGAGAAIANWAV